MTPLAYLWRRDQTELLEEMVSAGIDSILIKVAALGLYPNKHLGKTLAQIYPHMISMVSIFHEVISQNMIRNKLCIYANKSAFRTYE